MSHGPLDRSRFEAIEAYVLDTMSAEERVRFEQELAGDPALSAEVELQRENIHAVELGGITRVLKTVGAEHAKDQAERSTGYAWKQRLRYAAVVAIVLSGSLWLLRPSASERLFADHFVADPGLPVAMGSTDDPAFADAMVSYKEGHYAEASTKWSPLLQADPTNDTLRFYVASASLADGDASAAIPLLSSLTNDPTSTFRNKSRWFLFLAYLKAGEVEKAKALSFDGDPDHGERIRAIKAELN
jgi:predicted Zn-dependent protease